MDSQVAPKLYAPGGSMEVHGLLHQGGEEIAHPLDSSTRAEAVGKGAHSDIDKALWDSLNHYGPTEEERATIPSVGKPIRPAYASEPIVARPGKTAKEQIGHAIDPKNLDPEEWEHLKTQEVNKFVKAVNNLHAPELAAAAIAGRSKRYWYMYAAEALKTLLGAHEAPRFVTLLAATSPRLRVKDNFEKALEIWTRHQNQMAERRAAGNHAELTPEEARKWLAGEMNKVGPTGEKINSWAHPSHENNIIRALTAHGKDLDATVRDALSGPKVSAFRQNLLGVWHAVTNDMYMAALGNLNANTVSQGPRRSGKRTAGGEYLALSHWTRQATHLLNSKLKPGEKEWSPAEVQAAAWSFARAMAYEMGQAREPGLQSLTAEEALNKLTHETVRGNADFVQTLLEKNGKSNPLISALRRAGYGPKIETLRRRHKAGKFAPTSTLTGRVLSDVERAGLGAAIRPISRRATVVAPGFEGARGRLAYRKRMARDTSVLSASPNTDVNLAFPEALRRSRGVNNQIFAKTLAKMAPKFGMRPRTRMGVGDWEDGAEPSVLQEIEHPVTEAQLKYAAAWYGLMAHQKSVLWFRHHPAGPDSVYSTLVPETDLNKVRTALSSNGIKFRTLIPTTHGTHVVVFDPKRSLRGNISAFAGEHNAVVHETTGTGDFLGAGDDSSARRTFRAEIASYENGQPSPATSGQVREGPPDLANSGRPPTQAHLKRRGHKRRLSEPREEYTDPLALALFRLVSNRHPDVTFSTFQHAVVQTPPQAFRDEVTTAGPPAPGGGEWGQDRLQSAYNAAFGSNPPESYRKFFDANGRPRQDMLARTREVLSQTPAPDPSIQGVEGGI